MNKAVDVSLDIIEHKFWICNNFTRQAQRKGYFWMTQKDCHQILLGEEKTPNDLRYLRVGGRGQCLRCRKSPKPEN